jgi:hypothetical protein
MRTFSLFCVSLWALAPASARAQDATPDVSPSQNAEAPSDDAEQGEPDPSEGADPSEPSPPADDPEHDESHPNDDASTGRFPSDSRADREGSPPSPPLAILRPADAPPPVATGRLPEHGPAATDIPPPMASPEPSTSGVHSERVDILLEAARAYRAAGRPLSARDAAHAALDLAPGNPAARVELAWTYLDTGLPDRARAILDQHPRLEAWDVRAALERPRSLRIGTSAAASSDSFGMQRIAPRATVSFPIDNDIRFLFGGGTTHAEQEARSLTYAIGGGGIVVGHERIWFEGTAALVHDGEVALSDHSLRLASRPWDFAGAGLTLRHRPFLEGTNVLATGERAFHGAGTGGATNLDGVARLTVNEARLDVQLYAGSAAYFYAEGAGMQLGDGNQAYSLAGGGGLNVLALLAGPLPVDLLARWDTFMAGYEYPSADYFSQDAFDAHSAGGEVRWRSPWSLAISAEGGRTFPLIQDAVTGWFAGGGFELSAGVVRVQARGQVRKDPYFDWRRLWLGVELVP